MSVVAAKVYDDRIEIAADTICANGNSKMNTADQKMAKLFRFEDFVIGGVGKSEEISLFRRFFREHTLPDLDEDSIMDFLFAFMKWKKDLCGDDEIENKYMIAARGKCFCMRGLFVFPVNDYYAIGAGEDYARGALYVGATPVEAVKAACDLCVYVSEPIVLEIIPIKNEDRADTEKML